MYKHSTTHRTLSRRLAALLAALALLAAMALPVYAETLDGASEIGGTISDGNVTPENEPTTPEGEEKTEDENSESNEDSIFGQEQGQDQNESELDTDNETQDDETDVIEEPTQDDTDAEEQTKDETAEVSNEIATQAAAEDFTVYFAAPAAWGTPKQVTFIGKKGSEGTGNQAGNLEKDMSLADYVTSDGRLVYKVELHYQEPSDNNNVDIIKDIECPFNGYVWMKVRGDQQEVSLSDTWTYKDNFKGRCYIDGVWRDISELKQGTPHQRLAGKTMLFQNQSNHELTNVKAVFYEKINGRLQTVETIDLKTIATGKRVSFKIPKEDCSYIRFLVDEKETSLYNFYDQQDEGANNGHFLYDSGTACCYVYKEDDNGSSWTIPQGKITVYFDATFSSAYTENGDTLSIPTKGSEDVYCCFKNEQTTPSAQKMTPCGDNLYSVDVPEGYSKIMFSGNSLKSPVNSGISTDWVPIDWSLDEPCYMADTNDAVVYNNNAPRGGYWTEKNAVRDAEAGKRTTVVDIDKTTPFVQDSGTKYVNSTLYDYYTDWELNGNNRDAYDNSFSVSDRSWVPFRQFDLALSDYYKTSGASSNSPNAATYPIYTGHFQPSEYGSGAYPFVDLNNKLQMNLFGFEEGRKFMVDNNSSLCMDNNHSTDHGNLTVQGIVADDATNTSKDGLPVMRGTEKSAKPLVEPHFNTE